MLLHWNKCSGNTDTLPDPKAMVICFCHVRIEISCPPCKIKEPYSFLSQEQKQTYTRYMSLLPPTTKEVMKHTWISLTVYNPVRPSPACPALYMIPLLLSFPLNTRAEPACPQALCNCLEAECLSLCTGLTQTTAKALPTTTSYDGKAKPTKCIWREKQSLIMSEWPAFPLICAPSFSNGLKQFPV